MAFAAATFTPFSSFGGQRLVARSPAARSAAPRQQLGVQCRTMEAGEAQPRVQPPPCVLVALPGVQLRQMCVLLRCRRGHLWHQGGNDAGAAVAACRRRGAVPDARTRSRALAACAGSPGAVAEEWLRRGGWRELADHSPPCHCLTLVAPLPLPPPPPQFFKDGSALPATVIALEGGNMVTQVKTVEKDGYAAVQVGYQTCREKLITKPEAGHLRKAGVPPMKHLREFKVRCGAVPIRRGGAGGCWGDAGVPAAVGVRQQHVGAGSGRGQPGGGGRGSCALKGGGVSGASCCCMRWWSPCRPAYHPGPPGPCCYLVRVAFHTSARPRPALTACSSRTWRASRRGSSCRRRSSLRWATWWTWQAQPSARVSRVGEAGVGVGWGRRGGCMGLWCDVGD